MSKSRCRMEEDMRIPNLSPHHQKTLFGPGGGHIDRGNHCGHEIISYNSCWNRHCPKCQPLAKASRLEARKAELFNVDYSHLVFTLPKIVSQIANSG